MNKKLFCWLFAVILLVLLLALSVYLGISGWYFTTSFSQSDDMVLGNTVDIHVRSNQASTCSFSLSGGYIKGEKLPQIISVKNDEEDNDVFLRAKVYVYMEGVLADISLVTNDNWVLEEDGYYYFTDTLISQGKIGLCSHIVIDQLFNGDKKYIVTVAVEALRSDVDVGDLWGVDPKNLKQE